MTALHIDFETRSEIDLKKVGLDVYSRHPSTDVWCMGWAFDDDEPAIWTPDNGDFDKACEVADVILNVHGGGIFVAHNAAFELAIWNNIVVPRYGWPPLRPQQVRCTMAMAYAMSLPGSLEKAAAAVGIKEQKDLAGGRLMLQMAKPRSTNPTVWWDEPDKLARLYDYCKQDVRVERELDKRLMQLSASEQKVWQLDYAINQRGFHVDRPAIEAALAVVASERDRLDEGLRRVTGNFVGFNTETARLTQWVASHGVDCAGVAKADVLDLLERPALPPAVRTALLIRQEAAKTSVAKLDTIVTALSADGRMRGTLQYHGAGPGRWAGRRIQPHNFPRPKIPQRAIEEILDLLPSMVRERGATGAASWLDNHYGNPLDVLPWCLRGIITAAKGRHLMGADFSNIEGRGLAWLAGEEWKLDAFRAFDAGTGPDIYLVAAKMIWGRDFTKDDPERQHGKVAELACGFGGGVGAFQQMAKTYLVKVEDALAAEIKERWRARHPATVHYWYALEEAAIHAVTSDAIIATGPQGRQVQYRKAGSFLWCRLPSGRVLCYPYPQIRTVVTPWGAEKEALTFMSVPTPAQRQKGKILHDPSNRNDWARVSTYGGEQSQNIDEGICRDVLAEAMLRLDAAGAGVVIHCHDEALVEISETAPAEALPAFEKIFREVPTWATGLPIAADGWRGTRWQKG